MAKLVDIEGLFESVEKKELNGKSIIEMQEECNKCNHKFFLYKIEKRGVYEYVGQCDKCKREVFFNSYKQFKDHLHKADQVANFIAANDSTVKFCHEIYGRFYDHEKKLHLIIDNKACKELEDLIKKQKENKVKDNDENKKNN